MAEVICAITAPPAPMAAPTTTGTTSDTAITLATSWVLSPSLAEGSDVARYTIAFDRLVAAALHPDDSVQMIERLARTLR